MVEKKATKKEIEIVTMENIEKMYPWADYIDKAIIHTLINSPNSMSIYVFKKRFEDKILFWDRIERIIKEIPILKKWDQKKPTLQVGTQRQYERYLEELKDGNETM